MSSFNFTGDSASEEASEEIMALMTANLTFQIVESTTGENEATVKVEMSNVNMAGILGDVLSTVMADAFSSVFGDEEQSEEALNQRILDLFTQGFKENKDNIVTKTLDISMNLKNGQWKINANETLLDGMFGGLISSAASLMDFGQ